MAETGEEKFEANLKLLEEHERNLEAFRKSLEPFLAKAMIYQPPGISDRPASPDVTWNLTFGMGAGFLLSPLLAWMAIPLLERRALRRESAPPPMSFQQENPPSAGGGDW